MKRSPLVLAALVALGMTACADKRAPEEKNPAGPSNTEAKPQDPKAKPAPKEFASPSSFDLPPIAVGQWLRLVTRTTAEPPRQTFVRVVGKEGDAFWYEIETNAPTGTTIIQFLMDEAGRKSFEKSALKKLRVKAGKAPVQELSGPMIATAGSVVEDHAGLFGQPDLGKATREDRAVSAGNFKGCYVQEVERTVMGAAAKVKSWNHPAVPIIGFVRSESHVNDKDVTTELLEIHESGATSSL